MSDERPTSQHMPATAAIGGIGMSAKVAKQRSSSGKAAQKTRQELKERSEKIQAKASSTTEQPPAKK
ncbi:hypothetical protein MMC11_006569 [Xylographa trunciseda]|nr:hypothetical protein [Xylographa trunciseda]